MGQFEKARNDLDTLVLLLEMDLSVRRERKETPPVALLREAAEAHKVRAAFLNKRVPPRDDEAKAALQLALKDLQRCAELAHQADQQDKAKDKTPAMPE